MNWIDNKALTTDLKAIYGAEMLEAAESAFTQFA